MTRHALLLNGLHYGVLALGFGLAFGLLFILRARDKANERRDANRQLRLAAACSRLSRLRNRKLVFEQLLEEVRRFLPCTNIEFVASGDAAGPALEQTAREIAALLVREDAGPIGAVRAQLSRRRTIQDETTLSQLAESATVAIETIGLLEANRRALAEATASRREAEQARAGVESIMSAMSDAMLALDRDWCIVYLNPNAAAFLGETRDKLLGRLLTDLLPPQSDPVFVEELRQVAAERRDAVFRSRWPLAEKEGAWVMVRAFPREAGLTLYMQDITQQVETEERLRQTAKMDALGQLTGGIAHDFNNLLTVIIGNLEMLEETVRGNDLAAELVELAYKAGRRAANLTDRLLAFARRQPLTPATIEVSTLIDQLGGLLRRTLGTGIRVSIERERGLWTARADPAQLENALLNLAINARDAMHGAGELSIKVANQAIEQPSSGEELQPGEYVCISVADTGSGIDPAHLSKVFDPFFSTKAPGLGTGLGLSMVYGFARQSGGHVSIQSELGAGTVLQLMLPRGAGQADAAAPTFEFDVAPAGRGETILVVEDASLVRRYIRTVLENLGYRVTAASDGKSALAVFDAGARIDLLLTDVMLPGGMDGLAISEALRAHEPTLPVLFMSGFIDHEVLNKRSMSSSTLLRKPLRRSELAQRVRYELDHPVIPTAQTFQPLLDC